MANSLEQRVVPKENHWYSVSRWKLNEWLIFASLLISVFALLCFLWKEIPAFDTDYPIKSDKFGTFGDFIGGVIGTILAYLNVRLLIKTIELQNKANSQSEKSYADVQRTENVKAVDTQFNSLFILYQKIVDSMFFDGEQGKDAIHKIALKILAQNQQYNEGESGDKKATHAFEAEYATQRDKLAAYFRVVYRMLCLLKQADIDDDIRYNYAKLLRAQLTECELCLLRYNALTYNGRNMQDKILYFNLLKHLPASKLFDLQPFFNYQLENVVNYLDVCLFSFRRQLELEFIYGSHLGEEVSVKTKLAAFCLFYKVAKDRKSIEICFMFNRKLARRLGNEGQLISVYDDKQIICFFKAYLLELFSKSMFQVYTKVDELKFKILRQERGCRFVMSLNTQDEKRSLMITKKQLNKPRISFGPFIIGRHIVN